MLEHGLGRKPSPPDSRDWSVDKLFALMAPGTVTPIVWLDPVVLDQGESGHCVGYGSAGFLACAEAQALENAAITNADGERIYYEAKVLDGEPKAEDGSTVRSAAQVLQRVEQAIVAYAFGSFAEGKAWVQQHGPVVIGIDWYEGMFTPDAQGIVHPTGGVAGGHCILWHATDGPHGNTLRNSWGSAWGIGGDCYISDADLGRLIDAQGGEALFAVKAAAPFPAPSPGPQPTPPIPPLPSFPLGQRLLRLKSSLMRGTDVQWVQQKIGCLETDGVFDEKTYRSVRKYQELKRIRPATGSVTKATWKALGV